MSHDRVRAPASTAATSRPPARPASRAPVIGNRAFAALLARQVAAPPAPKRKTKRPSAQQFWKAYEEVKYQGKEEDGTETGFGAAEIWDLIGGNVAEAFGPDKNSCAARVSWALNHGGQPITKNKAPEKKSNIYFNSKKRKFNKGVRKDVEGDDQRYIVSSLYLEDYLTAKWGRPDARLKTNEAAQKWAESLEEGQIGVFSGRHHAGVIKKDTAEYKDPYVMSDPSVMPVAVWVLD